MKDLKEIKKLAIDLDNSDLDESKLYESVVNRLNELGYEVPEDVIPKLWNKRDDFAGFLKLIIMYSTKDLYSENFEIFREGNLIKFKINPVIDTINKIFKYTTPYTILKSKITGASMDELESKIKSDIDILRKLSKDIFPHVVPEE